MFRELFPSSDANSRDTHIALDAAHAPARVLIADAELLLGGQFKKAGADLIITGKDGHKVVVSGYFSFDKTPDLVTAQGAGLSGHVVERLSVPSTPGQYAQAGAPAAGGGIVIGKVERIGGSATVQHANGVREELKIGDNVLQGDVVETGGGSLLAISFSDGSAFNMGANARMMLDELTYDPGGSSNSATFNLIKGTITFVAGQVAKTGNMRVETPVATMGIRGTTVNTNIVADINGNIISVNFSLMPDPDGKTGQFNIIDKATNTIIATVTTTSTSFTITPSANLGNLAQQLNKTPDQIAQELAVAQVLFPIFLANPANFNNQNPQDPQPKSGTQHGSSGTPGGSTVARNDGTTGTTTTTTNNQSGNGNNNTNSNTTTITTHQNAAPFITIDAAPDLVEKITAGDLPGVPGAPTSVAQIHKVDLDGIVTYDTFALGQAGWIQVAPGVYRLDGVYGSAFLDTGSDTLTYQLDNVLADGLGPNDHPHEFFTIPIKDDGGATAFSTADFVINGRNDPPQLQTDQQGPHTSAEVTDTTTGGDTQTLDGTLAFTDPELPQTHTVPSPTNFASLSWEKPVGGGNFASAGTTPTGTSNALKTAFTTSIQTDSTGTGNGVVAWGFALADQLVDFLAEGERLVVTYNVTIIDQYGATTTQPVTVTITGTNDKSVITTGDTTGLIDEAAAQTGLTDLDVATGTLLFTDVDLNDTHQASAQLATASWSTGGSIPTASLNALQLAMTAAISTGVFGADSTGSGAGSLEWTFSLEDHYFDFIREGESLTLTYNVVVTDNSGAANAASVVKQVVVTVNATNDKPVITSTAGELSNIITETSATVGDATEHSVGGIVKYSDADLDDVDHINYGNATAVWTDRDGTPHSVTDAAIIDATRLTFGAVDQNANSASWTYKVADNALDFLREGETLVVTYTITVQDDSGATNSTSTTRDIKVTITGTNDQPTINVGDVGGAVVEDTTVADNPNTGTVETGAFLVDTGSISFNDVDTTDVSTVTVALTGSVTGSAAGISPALATALNNAVALTGATTAHDGTVNWTFGLDNSLVQYLADGETVTATYTITVQDDSGAGNATRTQDVTVTITGTNDQPTITIGDVGGAVVEDTTVADNPNTGTVETGAFLVDTGSISFNDADTTDVSTVTVALTNSGTSSAAGISPALAAALGGAVALTGATLAHNGTVNWAFALDNSLAQYLAAGETVTATYTITVQDDSGTGNATRTQDVTVTITGTNDRPTITAGNVSSSFVEDTTVADNPNTGTVESGAFLVDTGSISFNDVDSTDVSTVTVALTNTGTTSAAIPQSLLDALADAVALTGTTNAHDGTVGWAFGLDNSLVQYLAVGETVTATYTITVQDDSGTGNASRTQDVTITITGTNDDPVVDTSANITRLSSQSGPTLADPAAEHAIAPAISNDGRFVAYFSSEELPIEGANNQTIEGDVYLYDRATGTTKVLTDSAHISGAPAGQLYSSLSISSNGQFVAIQGEHFVPDGFGGHEESYAYIYDRFADTTTLLTNPSAGFTPYNVFDNPRVSNGGNLVFTFEDTVFPNFTSHVRVTASNGATILDLTATPNPPSQSLNLPALPSGEHYRFDQPDISGNSRYLTFWVTPTDQFNQSTGDATLYTYDRFTSTATAIATATGDGQDVDTWWGVMSDDGRFVVFQTDHQLIPGDTNTYKDVYVWDRQTSTLEGVSIQPGVVPDGDSQRASISGDGRFIIFSSYADNLVGVGGDANGFGDTFVYDRVAHTTQLLSSAADSTAGNGDSVWAADISVNLGTFAAFASDASNLVPGDTNNASDVFIVDRSGGTFGGVAEEVTAPPSAPAFAGAPAGSLSTRGAFDFSDDLTDAHTAGVVGDPVVVAPSGILVPTGGLGTFNVSVVENTADADPWSQVAWTFWVDNNEGAVQALGSGQRIFQTYTVAIDDGKGGTTTQTVTVSIAGSNDAPTLVTGGTTTLNAELEDAGAPTGAVGTLISDLVDLSTPAGGLDNVADIDNNAVTGIALTATAAGGTWYYSLDNGTNWSAVGVVSTTSALLLAADADTRLYFAPAADFNGTIFNAITFRAWDQTNGNEGIKLSTTGNGGGSAFSTVTNTASLTITSVNDAPTAFNSSVGTSEDIAKSFSISDFQFTDTHDTPVNGITGVIIETLPTHGTLTFNGNAVTEGQEISTALLGNLVYSPNQDYFGGDSFTYNVRDAGGILNGGADTSTAAATMSINIAAVNDAPVITLEAALSGSGWTFNPDNGHYYRLVVDNDGIDWITARGLAEGDNAYLATITSQSEQDFAYALTGATGAWLGGYSLTPENAGTWYWVEGPESGQPFTYTNWNPGEPNGFPEFVEGALHLEASGGWNDVPPSWGLGNTALTGYLEEWDGSVRTGESSAVVINIPNNPFGDIDAASNDLLLKLSVEHGVLENMSGLTPVTGHTGLDGTLWFTGTLAQLNAAIADGVNYSPTVGGTTNYSGTDALTIVLDDQGYTGAGGAHTATASIAIDVAPDADFPTITVPSTASGNEDQSISIGTIQIALNDTDGSETIASVVLSGHPAGATFSVGHLGSGGVWVIDNPTDIANLATIPLMMTPPPDYSGTFSLTPSVSILDTALLSAGPVTQSGGGSDGSIAVTVNPVNDAPVGFDDGNSAAEAGGTDNGSAGTTATGSVLTNDTDIDNTNVSLAVSAFRTGTEAAGTGTAGTLGSALAGQYGSLTLNANGSYTYTVDNTNSTVQALNSGGTLTDTFTYTVKDPGNLTDTAQLVITINGADDAPVVSTAHVDFNGSSALAGVVPTTQVGNGSSDGVTMAGWVSWNGSGNSGDAQLLFYNGSTSDSGFGVTGIVNSSGGLDLWLQHGSISGVSTGVTISADEWHNVALSHVNGEFKLYLDGVQEFTSTYSVYQIPGGHPAFMMIGGVVYPAVNTFDSQGFAGSIGRVSVWNTALSAVEVEALQFSSLTGNESALAGYWALNAGSGSTAVDAVGAGAHDLTFVGSPAWATASTILTNEDAGTALVAGPIPLNDIDAGSTSLLLKLSVAHGTLDNQSGLTPVTGHDGSDGTLWLTGDLAALNRAMTHINYSPIGDYNGSDQLTILVDDASGGGGLTHSASIAINVTPVNDAPVITTSAVTTADIEVSNFVTIDVPGASYTVATGINDAGDIVGQQGFTSTYGGWVYDGSSYTTITYPSATNTSANSINNSGLIAGYYEPGSSTPRYGLTTTDGSSFTTINLPPNVSTTADGINDAGVIVGSSYLHGGNTYSGFIKDGATETYLNPFGSTDAHANGINNAGDVVGTYGGTHGFLYSGGVFTTIDVPDADSTVLVGINDFNQIVGWYVDGGVYHGFVYSAGEFTTVDHASGANGTFVNDINNAGQIVGRYIDGGSAQHGFEAAIEVAHGTVGFTDVDVGDDHTASATAHGGGSGYIGNFTLDTPVDTGGTGSVTWHFNLENNMPLAAGQIQTQTYDVTIDDGHDTTTQSVSLTWGSASADTFHFNTGNGAETFLNFQLGIDDVEIATSTFADMTALLAATHDASNNAVVELGADTITFVGASKTQLQSHASDFHFV